MATAAASADTDKAALFWSFLLKRGKYLAGNFFFFVSWFFLCPVEPFSNVNITVP